MELRVRFRTPAKPGDHQDDEDKNGLHLI